MNEIIEVMKIDQFSGGGGGCVFVCVVGGGGGRELSPVMNI